MILNKILMFLKHHIKEFAKSIPVILLIFVVYVQCTKIGTNLLLETPGIKWYVSEENVSKEDLQLISNKANTLLRDKSIDPSSFDVNLILCGSTNEFLWKSLIWDESVLGVTRWIFGNTTINKSFIKEDRMDYNDSKLSAVIAHELCHIYLSKKLSLWELIWLDNWKSEGFCEYISEHSSLSVDKGLSLFLANDKAEIEKLDDKVIYFYFTARLKTDYLLGFRGVPFEEFIDTKYDDETLESEIRNALTSGEYEFLP